MLNFALALKYIYYYFIRLDSIFLEERNQCLLDVPLKREIDTFFQRIMLLNRS